jgi:phosphoribosylanthranilate isomerase
MPTRVKICGLRTEAALDAALAAGADFVGFVFHDASPRHVALPEAARLAARARGKAQIVALVVDPHDAALQAIADAVHPDMFQLHGDETPDRTRAIRTRSGAKVMKAVPVATPADAAVALAFRDAADLILFDAKPPPNSPIPGGNGIPFDWRALDAVRHRLPWILSGGLTPDNVAEAIRLTGATMVDVSSGVESARGVKDAGLIRRFVDAAKAAHAPAA